jgi:sec-independent protein translocase protein TatC
MTSEPAVPEIVPARSERSDGGVMPLVDHLAELRNRIVWSVAAIVIGTLLGFLVSDRVIVILAEPLPTKQPLVTFGVGDAFAIRLRISLVIGVILAMPVILWHVWRFVAPGLTASERRAVLPWIPAAFVMFAIGVGIAYIILPFAAQFLLSFQTPELQALLSAREYFDFVSSLFLAFGILMEFPVLLVGLSRVGIVTSQRLSRSRRYVALGIAVFSAIATPGGDLVSPAVLGVTLYALFELTILVIRRGGR